ncbi:MAG: phosphatase [Christensenellales bacterium]|jgi:hypothetical protein
MKGTISKKDAIRRAQREYARMWRAKNPDKVKAINDRYWLRRAQRMMKERGIPDTISDHDKVGDEQ